MNEFAIGNTKIPLSWLINSRLKAMRLSVSPQGILVESPEEPPTQRLVSFVSSRQEWIFNEWQRHGGRRVLSPWPEQFVSGAKVLFLGRMCPIERHIKPMPRLSYSVSGFELWVTENCSEQQCREMFVEFFGSFLNDCFEEVMTMNVGKIASAKPTVRITKRKDRWAYCDESRTLHLGWDLAFLPKKLIEYVLLHEICHLNQMNHGQEFWETLKEILPDYDDRKKALVEHEALHGL